MSAIAPAPGSSTIELALKIWRYDAETGEKELKRYEVEAPDWVTLLDVLDIIKDQQDGTLAYRKSCRMMICGSCGMRMDGAAVLACKTRMYDVANAAYIEEDPVAGLIANHESIALVHISDTGTDIWGHDPIGTGVVDFDGLGDAVEATCGVSNVVLEIIREENTLYEFDKAMHDLTEKGWKLDR